MYAIPRTYTLGKSKFEASLPGEEYGAGIALQPSVVCVALGPRQVFAALAQVLEWNDSGQLCSLLNHIL